MTGITARMPFQTPVRFTSKVNRWSAAVSSSIRRGGMPDSGVVDEHVQPAEGVRAGRDRRGPLLAVPDVKSVPGRLRAELVGDGPAIGFEHVGHQHAGTFGGEQARNRRSLPACPAGHQGDLSGQALTHGRLLSGALSQWLLGT